MKSSEHIAARVLEIQAVAAKSAEISVASLLDELEHARQRADSLGQLSASVRAISEKARLAGLVIERQQVEVVEADPFAEAQNAEDVLVKVASELSVRAAVALAAAFELGEYDEAAILALFNGANGFQPGHSQRVIEDRRPPRNRKREL